MENILSIILGVFLIGLGIFNVLINRIIKKTYIPIKAILIFLVFVSPIWVTLLR